METPWSYNIADPSCAQPFGQRLIHVDHIRFTQRRVNDSFSHNMRPILELIADLLDGQKSHREVPLIRVAWRDGAFWSIDNRRLFCYKHCKLGRILVEVCQWIEGGSGLSKEFDDKYRNGQDARASAQGGNQAGLEQRLPEPFPRSDVINITESIITCFMDEGAQALHDARRERLQMDREETNRFENQLCADIRSPWKYDLQLSDGCFPATVLEASVDGSFKVAVLRGEVQFMYPAALPAQFRTASVDRISYSLPSVQLQCTTFRVPQEVESKLRQPWCALCGRFLADVQGSHALRDHERSEHTSRDCFRCTTCGQSFSCSDDLRKHSRKKGHEILAAFSRHLGGFCQASDSPGHFDGSDEETRHTRELGPKTWDDQNEDTFVVVKGVSDHFPSGVLPHCAICLASFETEKKLRCHELDNHSSIEFRCSTCKKPHQSSIDLRKHSRATNHSIALRFLPCMRQQAETLTDDPGVAPSSAEAAVDVVHTCPTSEAELAMPMQTAPQSPIRQAFWLHVKSGQRLQERCGTQDDAAGGKHVGTGTCFGIGTSTRTHEPSCAYLGDFVLERWIDPTSLRHYLWCPVTQDWFWEDDADKKGWRHEVWEKVL